MPEEKAPAPRGVGTGDRSMDAPSSTEEIQKEQPAQDLGRISALTDIPAVAAYARRLGARDRSLRKLVVEEKAGRYRKDVAVITFDDNGEVDAPDPFAPVDEEREAIRKAWGRYSFPAYQPRLHTGLHPPSGDDVPWSKAREADVAICWDEKREHILCVEERREKPDGTKDVFIWTYWDDGEWRVAEPPAGLPLFGLEKIGAAATVFVHEGPKKAKAMQALIANDGEGGWKDHPWGADLRGPMLGSRAHVAWLGGAYRATDTDWSPLTRANPSTVIISCDNDDPGKNAVRPISRRLQRSMLALEFDDRFKPSFDLADKMPEAMFEDRGGKPTYTGPALTDLLQPATWATQELPRVQVDGRRQRGQTGFAVREEFAREWAYIVSLGVFVKRDMPSLFFKPDQFNIAVRPVSDVEDTAKLLHLLRSLKVHGVVYDPGQPSGVINVGGLPHLNTHVRPAIKPVKGDPRPFLRYLRHLIPNRADRAHLQRWIATLIARPDVRMTHALMLMSETQGVGKTTLTEHILTPLLGSPNVSNPSEAEITDSAFTDWIGEKRLISVDEIYAGHSRRTYDALKGRITGTEITVNRKFLAAYKIPNWAHFIVTSNAKVPLFMDAKDRRWFIPEVTESSQPRKFWVALHKWLDHGGLAIIAHWAECFVRSKRGHVEHGVDAPNTVAKAALVEDSLSDEMRLIRDLADDIAARGRSDPPERIIFTLDNFREWLARHPVLQGRKRLNGQAVQAALKRAGLVVRGRDPLTGQDQRPKIDGLKRVTVLNFQPSPGDRWPELVRAHRRTLEKLSGDDVL
jgi:hypothetical protein